LRNSAEDVIVVDQIKVCHSRIHIFIEREDWHFEVVLTLAIQLIDTEATLHVVAKDLVSIGVELNFLYTRFLGICLSWVDLWHELVQRLVLLLAKFPSTKNTSPVT
jgi:hypothetical protein